MDVRSILCFPVVLHDLKNSSRVLDMMIHFQPTRISSQKEINLKAKVSIPDLTINGLMNKALRVWKVRLSSNLWIISFFFSECDEGTAEH